MNRLASVRFANEFVLDGELISKVCLKVLKTIENELPEETHSYEVYEYMLDTSKEMLQEKKIVL